MRLPHATRALVERLDAVNRRSHVAGMRAVAALPGNPFGMEVAELDGASALRSRRVKVVDHYNRVFGLRESHADRIAVFADFYRSEGIVGRFDVHQANATAPLMKALAAEDFVPESTKPVLYAAAEAGPARGPDSPGVEIVESQASQLDAFLDVWAEGFGIPEFLRDNVKAIRREWFRVPGFRRFLASCDGEPAGVGGLFVDDDVGYLCFAATRPPFRGRGVQTRLVERRWEAAIEAGCTLVITETEFDTQSQHNMERAGMRIAFMKTSWVDSGDAV